MTRETTWKLGVIAAVVLSAVALGHRVFADGIPAEPTMYYAGELLEDGTPVSGTRRIVVALWTSETEIDSARFRVCDVLSASTAVDRGHFRVPLRAECTAAVHTHSSLFVEVQVGSDPPLPRVRLGAVPYAVEADTAQRTRARVGSVAISGGATYCNVTGPTTGAITTTIAGMPVDGYVAARSLCATACGSSTAHMCSSDEIVRSAQLGSIPTTAATPLGFYATGGSDYEGTRQYNDCTGFRSGSASQGANFWEFVNGNPVATACSAVAVVVCCD